MAADETGGARVGLAEAPAANGLADGPAPPVISLDLHRRSWSPAEPTTLERGRLRPIRVLVLAAEAEDVAIVRSLLARAEQARFEVRGATDAAAALAALARDEHDVCLCEQRQPTGGGLDFAREAVRRGIAAPVVLTSALGLPNLDLDAIAAGAADFLDKEQFEVEGLERVLRLALARARRQAAPPPRGVGRELFSDRLRRALARARRHGSQGAVIHLAVDRLDGLPRRHRPEEVASLLDGLADRLAACLRETDTVLRLDHNLFGAVLEELHRPEHAALAAKKLVAAVAACSTDEIAVTASAGLALITPGAVDPATLDGMAAAALARAQAEGTGRCCQHDREAEQAAAARLTRADELGQAILADELDLAFRPQVTLRSAELVLAAVAQWRHPEAGLLEGDRLLAVAEAGGLVEALDDWTIAAACGQAAMWQRAGPAPAHVAVPLLSRRRLRWRGLALRLASHLETADLAPPWLELEIDERLLLDDLEAGGAAMRELRGLGVRLAVPGFGAGPTSLALLRDGPLATVKLAPGLLRGAPVDETATSFGLSVMRFARDRRLRLVAEAVDDQEQLRFLRDHGCDAVQACASSPPLPPDACGDWLRQAACRG